MRKLTGTAIRHDRVRRTLVDTLYAQPFSLILANAVGICCAVIAAVETGWPLVYALSGLLTLVAALRCTLALIMPRLIRRAGLLERVFELGAFSYAALLGMIAAVCVAHDAAPAVQLLTACNAVAFGAAVPARNSGRPLIAIGQLVLVTLPVVLALALRPDLPSRGLALCILVLVPGMTSVVRQLHQILRQSIDAAETSARLAERMQQLARTDVVTGLLNRAGLNHELVDRAGQVLDGRRLALLWLDLDRFKDVNDTLGHQIGDRVLAEVGQRLVVLCSPDAAIARFGGDEFIIACTVTDLAEGERLAQALLEGVTAPMRLQEGTGEWRDGGGVRVLVGTSIGIALMPDDAIDIDTLMQHADLALYNAKVNGRGQAAAYRPSMIRALAMRREIEDDLRLAIQRGELSIFFQPIIDLSSGRIRSFEALVRWFHPEKGELAPDVFIPIAEETGAIITLGNWITANAARVAASWPEDVTLAVNLSPLQIRAPGAALGILAALREAGLPPHRLELEITETVLLDQSALTDAFMADLARAGVHFALDDFGIGYSSLSYLSKYAFSRIKVDRSFISGPNAGARSDAIIRAVSEMATRLDMEIVAEGIETAEQARAMIETGCTLGQGYYFSRAVPDYLAGVLLMQEQANQPQLRLVI